MVPRPVRAGRALIPLATSERWWEAFASTAAATILTACWGTAASSLRETAPAGVVAVVDRARDGAGCAGTIVKSTPDATGFVSYVLTAKHCVVRGDGEPYQVGVGFPSPGDLAHPFPSSHVLSAALAYTSSEDRGRIRVDAITWVEFDWAILKVHSEHRLPVVATFDGDPSIVIAAGTSVAFAAQMDDTYVDDNGRLFLRPHEHLFAWDDVPGKVVQSGHSGGPVLWDGKVVAVFVGASVCSPWPWCRLVRWASLTSLSLVSIASIRKEAAEQGFAFE